MPNLDRRSAIVGGVALVTGGVFGPLGLAGAQDDGETNADGIEVSISATDSTPVLKGHADFLIRVTNNDADAVSVPVTLEIAHVDRELETLELDAGERGDAYVSIEARSLGSGEHEWTVTAGDATETGTLTVEPVEGYDEDREGLELTVHTVDGATARIGDDDDSTRVGFTMTLFNHGDEPISTEGTFEIGGETRPILVDLGARGSQRVSHAVELGPGEYDWSVTVDDECATGTLTVVC